MTEEEAKTKWCPEARIPTAARSTIPIDANTSQTAFLGVAANRTPDGETPVEAMCLASGCMHWRWEILPQHPDAPIPRTPTGFCGLSGRYGYP